MGLIKLTKPHQNQTPPTQHWNHSLATVLIAGLIGLLPITMMTELRGGSVNFWALVLASLICSSLRPGGIQASIQSLSSYRLLILAFLVLPITVVMAMLWSNEILGGDMERAVRVFVGTTAILGACLSLKPAGLKHSIWGFMAGVIGGTGTLMWASWPHFTRPEMDQYTTVGYSNLLLLLSVIVLFSLGWQLTRFKRTEQVFKLLTVIAGLVGLVIAQTRSSWMAVPFFIVVGLILIRSSISGKRLFLLGIIATTLSVSVFFANPTLLARSQQGAKEFIECRSTTPIANTSVCIRLQLWRASWQMFKANPLLANAGSAQFEEKLEQLYQQGFVSEYVKSDFGEPHNDLFHALANYGIMGLLAFLLMYLVPTAIFAQRLSIRFTHETRVAAAMGLAVCVGFMAFGFTEAMFRSMRMLSFYAVLVAWLLALSHVDRRITKP